MTQEQPQEDLSAETLLQPGTIEALVKDRRIPLGFGIITEGNGAPQTSFWIPPAGIKPGDTMDGDGAYGFEFYSPEGESRGRAEWHIVPREIGEQIKARVNAELSQLKKSSSKQ